MSRRFANNNLKFKPKLVWENGICVNDSNRKKFVEHFNSTINDSLVIQHFFGTKQNESFIQFLLDYCPFIITTTDGRDLIIQEFPFRRKSEEQEIRELFCDDFTTEWAISNGWDNFWILKNVSREDLKWQWKPVEFILQRLKSIKLEKLENYKSLEDTLEFIITNSVNCQKDFGDINNNKLSIASVGQELHLILFESLDLTGNEKVRFLPANLTVHGDFNITRARNFKYIPDNVNISGRFICRNCKRLDRIGKNLKCSESCFLVEMSNLEEIGEGFSVERDLNLSICPRLVKLPNDLFVGKSINLTRNISLLELPENLHFNGDLILKNCVSLKKLLNIKIVNGDLDLSGCSSIVSLPEKLEVCNNMSLKNCSSLSVLPNRLTVGGKLDMASCTSIETIDSKDIYIGGDLDCSNCSNLLSVESGLKLVGNVSFRNCISLTKLNNTIKFPKDLDCSGCSDLISIDFTLLVGNLSFHNCPKLIAVQDELSNAKSSIDLSMCKQLVDIPMSGLISKGGGNISLSNCSNIVHIKLTKLIVSGDGGDLNFSKCNALKTLECEEIFVENGNALFSDCLSLSFVLCPRLCVPCGEINFYRCCALQNLPEGLSFSTLNLDECSSISSLPNDILNWGDQADDERKNVFLSGTGLSLEQQRYLQYLRIPNVQFHGSLRGVVVTDEFQSEDIFQTFDEAISFWGKIAELSEDEFKTIDLANVVPLSLHYGVLLFLSKLRRAKEFSLDKTKKDFAIRVMEVLDSLHKDPEDEMFIRMNDSVDACNDKPVWALNQLFVIRQITKARGNEDELIELGRKIKRLDIVHQHAKRKIESLFFVDDVCVYLKFEIELRDELNLPVSAVSMHFPSYIKITKEELKAAKDEALAVTEEEFHEWLHNWTEWQRELRRQYAVNIVWDQLEKVKTRNSLKVRLGKITNVFGSKILDPILLNKSIWSLSDLLKHWIENGLDLNNKHVSIDEMKMNLKRI